MIINSIIKGAGKVVLDGIYKTAEGVFQTITTAWGWTSNYRWNNVECDGDDLVLSEVVGLDFDGTSDKVEISDDASLRPGTDDFTISAWIKPPNQNQTGMFFAKRATISPYNQVALIVGSWSGGNMVSSKRIGFVVIENNTSKAITAYSNSDVADGGWHHIALTRNSDTYLLYIDGSSVGFTKELDLGSGAFDINNTMPVLLGSGVSDYEGKMYDVRFYRELLSATDIEDLYNGKTVDDTNLEGWWKLDEGTGTSATDSSDNTNTGTITGATWFNEYFETGERVSTPLLIPAHTTSNIQWEKETDEDTDVKVYTGISDSDDEESKYKKIKIGPSDDAYVVSSQGNTNYGSNVEIVNGGSSDVCLLGIKFDISDLPQKAKTAKIYLKVKVKNMNTKWRRIESSWSEGTITYNNRPTGMNNNSGTLCSVPAVGEWMVIDITTLYNQWKDGTYNNYGIALNGDRSSYDNVWLKFASKENTVIADRPYLEVQPEVEYTEATNDSTIPDLEANKYLYCKQVLSTEDTSKTPKLNSLKIKIT